jgi:hypothetical protein
MQVFPLRKIDAETVADKIVLNWCCIFGIPTTLLSDGGTQYQSRLIDLIYEYFDIKRLKTTPFHPATNGLSERAVSTVKTMVKAFVNDDQKNWDKYLNQLTMAYNSAVHRSTKFSPFELMFGRKPKIPLDLFVPHQQHDLLFDFNNMTLPAAAKLYLNGFKQKMASAFRIAADNRDVVMKKARILHERHIRKLTYQPGDLVLLNHPPKKVGLTGGLNKRFHGPYEIIERCENGVDYIIKSINRQRNKTTQVHCSRLKIYHGDRAQAANQPEESDSESESIESLSSAEELDDEDEEFESECDSVIDEPNAPQATNLSRPQRSHELSAVSVGAEEIESSSDSSTQLNTRRSKRQLKRINYNENKRRN